MTTVDRRALRKHRGNTLSQNQKTSMPIQFTESEAHNDSHQPTHPIVWPPKPLIENDQLFD
jgi:hypothetical protein